MLALVLLFVALDVCTCPVSCTTWRTGHVVQKSPERVVTLNQGTLEILLALGFHFVMVGTAYIDDYIWPQYATEYASIPALGGSSYPNESVTMSVKPDFVVASYKCASHETYVDSRGRTRGIFSNDTICQCIGKASEWEGARNTCRPQMHAAGIGTYFFADACEDTSLPPPKVAEAAVYQEMRGLGNIFDVDVEPLMTNMIDEFNDAVAMVSSAMVGTQMRAVWLDCVGRRCKSEVPDYVFIGAGDGALRMLMREAGLKIISAGEDGNMACALESQVIAANLDVFIVVDAVWDRGINPMIWVHRQNEMCEMGVLKGARFIQIPVRAATLGPRNGTAAVDLAVASLHVRVGSLMAVRKSGIGSFNPSFIENYVEGLACSADEDCIVYTDAAPSSTPGPTPSPTPAPTPSPTPAPTLASTPSPTPAPTATPIATAENDVLSGHPPIQSAHWPWALALVLAWSSLL